ncbi:MAG: hypothetical protein B6244_11590 [Candidatus Cloacimonetes bacterium 4572_55]|nr:MAG: hypothetical protein B6244_11590 [Candidatus Cloacimonetes bacterium 4572_55]
MNDKLIHRWITSIIATIGLFCLSLWIMYDPTARFIASGPGTDNRPLSSLPIDPKDAVQIGQYFEKYEGVAADLPGSWIQFRGKNRDNISTESVPLADQWDEDGPDILWSVDLGEGHAGPAVHNGRIYLLDYDEEKKADALRCFSLADGKEIWRRWYSVHIKRNHGISRTVPAVTDSFAVTIGPRCHVLCVSADSGNFLWGLDLEKDFGTETPLWYTGQCPLIDDSLAVVAPAGNVLMIGVHLRTGEVLWQTPNPHGWKMSHSSIMTMTLHGKRMYVYCAIGGIVGVIADGADRGKLAWETDLWDYSVVAPSPMILENGRIFITAGYSAGSMMLQVVEEEGGFSVKELQRLTPKQGMASEQQTPILYDGYLFGVLPKDAGAARERFVCYSPDDCSQLIWSSGKTDRFGLGPYLVADNKFFVLGDNGLLTMMKCSTTEYIRLGQSQVLQGADAWGPLAIVGGRMLLRDSKRMICIDIAAH